MYNYINAIQVFTITSLRMTVGSIAPLYATSWDQVRVLLQVQLMYPGCDFRRKCIVGMGISARQARFQTQAASYMTRLLSALGFLL